MVKGNTLDKRSDNAPNNRLIYDELTGYNLHTYRNIASFILNELDYVDTIFHFLATLQKYVPAGILAFEKASTWI